ncbi:MmgE/PrpD family protein [Peristeroidobacter soli]|uniref:MmgE/PrpD family protein n=1 Tax=Peristeroidobacter soli TaxID=2497877 RepID=UPI00101C949E|nr:MmgE/PrpD family protein [Peristeroidobacter soli]
MNYTETLADFACQVSFDQLPPGAVHAGKQLILDTLGCAVAGHDMPSSRIVRRVIAAYGGSPEATVLVSGERLPAALASYVNSHIGNAIDADDTLHYKAHIAAAAVAPALAIAERMGSSGRDFLSAVIVGYEVAGRIAMSLRSLIVTEEGKFQFGPVSGYSCIAFASTVCAGRLLGLNREQMLHAFGITAASAPLPASSQFGRVLPRPMTKYAMYGTTAESGVVAALLAQGGFTAERGVLDGEQGFWRVVGSLGCNWDALTARLGERWAVEEVIYKVYPGCRFLNAAIDMFYDLCRRHGIEVDEIERIDIGLHGAALAKHMDDPNVVTMVDACFSAPYLLAAAAYAGPPGPSWHTPEARADERIKRFMKKVTVALEPTAAAIAAADLRALGHNARMPSSLRIVTSRGDYSARVEYSKGDPYSADTKCSDADLANKFRNFCVPALGEASTDAALARVWAIDGADDVRELVRNLIAG